MAHTQKHHINCCKIRCRSKNQIGIAHQVAVHFVYRQTGLTSAQGPNDFGLRMPQQYAYQFSRGITRCSCYPYFYHKLNIELSLIDVVKNLK